MPITLHKAHNTEEQYVLTLSHLTDERWETENEEDLLGLIEGYVSAGFENGFDRVEIYNLENYSGVLDGIRDKIIAAATKRQSLPLMRAAGLISDHKASLLKGWIDHRAAQREKANDLEERHIRRVASETADEAAKLVAWL